MQWSDAFNGSRELLSPFSYNRLVLRESVEVVQGLELILP